MACSRDRGGNRRAQRHRDVLARHSAVGVRAPCALRPGGRGHRRRAVVRPDGCVPVSVGIFSAAARDRGLCGRLGGLRHSGGARGDKFAAYGKEEYGSRHEPAFARPTIPACARPTIPAGARPTIPGMTQRCACRQRARLRSPSRSLSAQAASTHTTSGAPGDFARDRERAPQQSRHSQAGGLSAEGVVGQRPNQPRPGRDECCHRRHEDQRDDNTAGRIEPCVARPAPGMLQSWRGARRFPPVRSWYPLWVLPFFGLLPTGKRPKNGRSTMNA